MRIHAVFLLYMYGMHIYNVLMNVLLATCRPGMQPQNVYAGDMGSFYDNGTYPMYQNQDITVS